MRGLTALVAGLAMLGSLQGCAFRRWDAEESARIDHILGDDGPPDEGAVQGIPTPHVPVNVAAVREPDHFKSPADRAIRERSVKFPRPWRRQSPKPPSR